MILHDLVTLYVVFIYLHFFFSYIWLKSGYWAYLTGNSRYIVYLEVSYLSYYYRFVTLSQSAISGKGRCCIQILHTCITYYL